MTDFENRDAVVEALTYALNSDYRVIQFERNESGELTIADITDHVKQLEKAMGIEDE